MAKARRRQRGKSKHDTKLHRTYRNPITGGARPAFSMNGLCRVARRAWLVISFLSTIGGLSVLLPRLTVSAPSAPLKGFDRASVSFDVANNGVIPLNDIAIGIGFGIAASGSNAKMIGTPDFKSVVQPISWQDQHLGSDDRFTIVLSDVISGGIVSADLTILVKYRPWILPVRLKRQYRFATYEQIDGENHWRSLPLDAPRPEGIKLEILGVEEKDFCAAHASYLVYHYRMPQSPAYSDTTKQQAVKA